MSWRMTETERYDFPVNRLFIFVSLSCVGSQEPNIKRTYSEVAIASIVACLAGELFDMLTIPARVHEESWRIPHVKKQIQAVGNSNWIDTRPSCRRWLIHSCPDVDLPSGVVGVVAVFADPFEGIYRRAGRCDGVSPSIMEVSVGDVTGAVGEEAS